MLQPTSSLIDVIDRILDKGIVVDAWARISLVGIDLNSIEARVIIASVETWLHYGKDAWRDRGRSRDDDPGDGGEGGASAVAARLPWTPPGAGPAAAPLEVDPTIDDAWARLLAEWRDDDPAGRVA